VERAVSAAEATGVPDTPGRLGVIELGEHEDPESTVRQFDPSRRVVPDDPATPLAPESFLGHAELPVVSRLPHELVAPPVRNVPADRRLNHACFGDRRGSRKEALDPIRQAERLAAARLTRERTSQATIAGTCAAA